MNRLVYHLSVSELYRFPIRRVARGPGHKDHQGSIAYGDRHYIFSRVRNYWQLASFSRGLVFAIL